MHPKCPSEVRPYAMPTGLLGRATRRGERSEACNVVCIHLRPYTQHRVVPATVGVASPPACRSHFRMGSRAREANRVTLPPPSSAALRAWPKPAASRGISTQKNQFAIYARPTFQTQASASQGSAPPQALPHIQIKSHTHSYNDDTHS